MNAQEPCVPATAVFYELVAQAFGIELADAAEPLATAEIVKRQCLLSGFKDVQVSLFCVLSAVHISWQQKPHTYIECFPSIPAIVDHPFAYRIGPG